MNWSRLSSATPSTWAMSSPMPVGKLWKLADCTRKSAANWSSTRSSLVALREAARVPTAATSASPIISAEAVAPVRRGLRSAFSPASRPVVPKTLPKTARHATSSGWPSTGLITAAVRIHTTAAAPIQIASLPGAPTTPATARPTPASITTEPMRARRPSERSPGPASSRIAATGAVREARRAGR